MSRRAVQWIVALGAIDLLAFGLALHSALTYTPAGAGAPTVMPLGQLLGWIVFGVLLVAIGLIVKESRR